MKPRPHICTGLGSPTEYLARVRVLSSAAAACALPALSRLCSRADVWCVLLMPRMPVRATGSWRSLETPPGDKAQTPPWSAVSISQRRRASGAGCAHPPCARGVRSTRRTLTPRRMSGFCRAWPNSCGNEVLFRVLHSPTSMSSGRESERIGFAPERHTVPTDSKLPSVARDSLFLFCSAQSQA